MKFIRRNFMGIVFVFVMFGISCLNIWTTSVVKETEELENRDYLTSNLY